MMHVHGSVVVICLLLLGCYTSTNAECQSRHRSKSARCHLGVTLEVPILVQRLEKKRRRRVACHTAFFCHTTPAVATRHQRPPEGTKISQCRMAYKK